MKSLVSILVLPFLIVGGVNLPKDDYMRYMDMKHPAAIRSEFMKTMMSYINNDTDPCQDFFNYACGKFTPVAAEAGNLDMMLDKWLSTPQVYDQWESKMKVVYKSCKEPDIIKILKSFGKWPIFGDWTPEEETDWIGIAMETAKYNVSPLFEIESDGNGEKKLTPTPPSIGSHSLSEFREMMEIHLNKLNYTFDENYVRKMSVRVFVFEKQLRQDVLTSEDLYFGGLDNIHLPMDDVLYVPDGIPVPYVYLKRIEKLFATKSKRTIADFFFWRILFATQKKVSSPDECLAMICQSEAKPCREVLRKEYFDLHSKDEILRMAADLRQYFYVLFMRTINPNNTSCEPPLQTDIEIGWPDELLGADWASWYTKLFDKIDPIRAPLMGSYFKTSGTPNGWPTVREPIGIDLLVPPIYRPATPRFSLYAGLGTHLIRTVFTTIEENLKHFYDLFGQEFIKSDEHILRAIELSIAYELYVGVQSDDLIKKSTDTLYYGLDPRQEFFISYAQRYCDPRHVPDNQQENINEVVKYTNSFHKTFNCTVYPETVISAEPLSGTKC